MKDSLSFPTSLRKNLRAREKACALCSLKRASQQSFLIIRRFVLVARQREPWFCSSTFSLGQLFSLVLKKVLDRKAIRSYKCALLSARLKAKKKRTTISMLKTLTNRSNTRRHAAAWQPCVAMRGCLLSVNGLNHSSFYLVGGQGQPVQEQAKTIGSLIPTDSRRIQV